MKRLISDRFRYDPRAEAGVAFGSEAGRAAAAAVRAKLEGGEYRLLHYPCPCGADAGDCAVSERDRFGLPLAAVVCAACGTLRLDPYLDGPSLEDFYVNFYQRMYGRALDMAAYLAHQHAYGRKILRAAGAGLRPSGWVFEVGCGAGGALRAFAEAGFRVAGCDYSADLIEEARRGGVEHAHQGTLADLGRALGTDVRADLIYLHHVFEHLNDPGAFLEECRRHLRPGGRVAVVVPDVSRIDAYPIPDADLLVFLHVAHKYNFTFEGLARLCARAGFEAAPLAPDHSIRTRASDMPELWVEMRSEPAPAGASAGAAAGVVTAAGGAAGDGRGAGERMLRYLAETERLYARRQFRLRMRARLGLLSPRRLVHRLRHAGGGVG